MASQLNPHNYNGKRLLCRCGRELHHKNAEISSIHSYRSHLKHIYQQTMRAHSPEGVRGVSGLWRVGRGRWEVSVSKVHNSNYHLSKIILCALHAYWMKLQEWLWEDCSILWEHAHTLLTYHVLVSSSLHGYSTNQVCSYSTNSVWAFLPQEIKYLQHALFMLSQMKH